MKKYRTSPKEMGFQSTSTAVTFDELIFNILKFGAFTLITGFLWFILLMGGIH